MGNLLLVLFIIAIVVFYFWTIMPRIDRARRQELKTFAAWDYAHRGLWDLELGIPENSIPAFERAIEQNVAIELDVHLTRDNRLVVIHDSSLYRLCGVDGIVEQMTFDELSTLKLSGTEEHMPLLGQVLRIIRGRVPLMIEIKLDTWDSSICSYLYKEMEFYTGDYMVQSFNPLAIRWYRKRAPHILTGQLSSRYPDAKKMNPIIKYGSYLMLANSVGRPDFISYEYSSLDSLSLRICHQLYRAPVFVWVVRSMNQYRQVCAQYDGVIFEHFLP